MPMAGDLRRRRQPSGAKWLSIRRRFRRHQRPYLPSHLRVQQLKHAHRFQRSRYPRADCFHRSTQCSLPTDQESTVITSTRRSHRFACLLYRLNEEEENGDQAARKARLVKAGQVHWIVEVQSSRCVETSRTEHSSLLRRLCYLQVGPGTRGSDFKEQFVANPKFTGSRKTKMKQRSKTSRVVKQEIVNGRCRTYRRLAADSIGLEAGARLYE